MGKLICLMGKSSSGKDTIYKELRKNKNFDLKKVTSYTTRPIREGEAEGVQYHFVSTEQALEMEREGRVIEMRIYPSAYGPWRYFTADDGQIELDKADYILIGTLETLVALKKYYGEEKIIPIYIEVEDGLRLQRALDRERAESSPKYDEMCRRFLADTQDFSEEKIKEAGVTKRFINESLEDTLSQVESYIREALLK
ncbi:MAG: guanylate kinase [Lachnospiraceae bacterium]|nr:guanylate kinase [Lachnospiraceae bacterium]